MRKLPPPRDSAQSVTGMRHYHRPTPLGACEALIFGDFAPQACRVDSPEPWWELSEPLTNHTDLPGQLKTLMDTGEGANPSPPSDGIA